MYHLPGISTIFAFKGFVDFSTEYSQKCYGAGPFHHINFPDLGALAARASWNGAALLHSCCFLVHLGTELG